MSAPTTSRHPPDAEAQTSLDTSTFLLALHLGQLIPTAVTKYVQLCSISTTLNHAATESLRKHQGNRRRNANQCTRAPPTSSPAHAANSERREPQETIERVEVEVGLQTRPSHKSLLVRGEVLV